MGNLSTSISQTLDTNHVQGNTQSDFDVAMPTRFTADHLQLLRTQPGYINDKRKLNHTTHGPLTFRQAIIKEEHDLFDVLMAVDDFIERETIKYENRVKHEAGVLRYGAPTSRQYIDPAGGFYYTRNTVPNVINHDVERINVERPVDFDDGRLFSMPIPPPASNFRPSHEVYNTYDYDRMHSQIGFTPNYISDTVPHMNRHMIIESHAKSSDHQLQLTINHFHDIGREPWL